MSVPNRQIGWSDKTNMLWNILREIRELRKQINSSALKSTTGSTTTTHP